MPRLRAAFRNGVDHATEGAAKFRLKATRLYLYFLNEVRLKILADAADVQVGGVNAVDKIDVLPIAGAINLESAGASAPGALERFLPCAGSKRNHRLE